MVSHLSIAIATTADAVLTNTAGDDGLRGAGAHRALRATLQARAYYFHFASRAVICSTITAHVTTRNFTEC